MNKAGKIALHEYLLHVRKRRFIFGLLSVPLITLVLLGFIIMIASLEMSNLPIGYVDHSGLLTDPLPAPPVEPPLKPVAIHAYPDEASAEAAMEAGEIAGYYILPEDYLNTGRLSLIYAREVKEVARLQFYDLLSANLLRTVDPAVADRILEGSKVTIELPGSGRSITPEGWFNLVMPVIVGVFFIMTMFTTGGYLMQAMVDEKENRTMEVILTSVSPNQVMTGKIIGNTAVGLTQIVIWTIFIIVTILIGRNYADFLKYLTISPRSLLIALVILLPSFFLVAALMAAMGATVTEAREGQQITGLLAPPTWLPYMLTAQILQTPNSPVAVVLSMLPLTAPLTILMRDMVTNLPSWQIALSAGIQIIGALGAIWLAGRAFRLGMLRYGKRVKFRELFARDENKASPPVDKKLFN